MLNGGRSSCCLSFGFCLSQSPNFFFNSPTSWGVENFQLRPNRLQGAVDGPPLRFKIALPLFSCGVLLGVDAYRPAIQPPTIAASRETTEVSQTCTGPLSTIRVFFKRSFQPAMAPGLWAWGMIMTMQSSSEKQIASMNFVIRN